MANDHNFSKEDETDQNLVRSIYKHNCIISVSRMAKFL